MPMNTNQLDNAKFPERDSKDIAYTIYQAILSAIPLGSSASILISNYLGQPIDSRREEWLRELFARFLELQNRVENLTFEFLQHEESFVTTFASAYQAVITNHQKENLDALRNAVLNSALPDAPDDIRQKMFVQWASELTPWHLKILAVFESARLPSIDLDKPEWEMNIAVDELATAFEEQIPELKGQFSLFIQILKDLRFRGLIANLIPGRGTLTAINDTPKLTPTAREFMQFIKPPTKTQ